MPRRIVFLILPLVAVFVILLTYLRLFSSTVVIVVLLVLYVAVSLWNRRKFSKGEEKKTDQGTRLHHRAAVRRKSLQLNCFGCDLMRDSVL